MGFLRKRSEGQSPDKDALAALERLERVADTGSAIEGMEMMASITGGYSAALGPNGPLHDRFIAAIEKIRIKVSEKMTGTSPISDAEIARLRELMSRMEQ